MQRWIAVAVVAMILMAGGAYYGRKFYRENYSPAPMWVPIQINPTYPSEKIDEVLKELKARLTEESVLLEICKDLSLAKHWQLSSDAAAAAELKKRMFVKLDEMDSPLGKVPAIHVGVRGKAKEKELSGKIATRLMKDVG